MTTFLPLYFLTFALLVAVTSGTNSTSYFPQYTPIDTPAYLLPTARHGSACTRAELNVSSFANQRNLLNASGVIDSIVCFGGFSRQHVPDGTYLEDTGEYVVGGVWHTYNLNDINLFDLQGERWYSINFDNATIRKYDEGYFENGHPMGRAWSSIFIQDNKMFVFGGASSQTFLDSSVLVYDFVRNNWTILSFNVTAGEAPRPRHGHTATMYNGKAYIFGGYWPIPRFPTYISPGNVKTYLPDFFNDVWEFDMTTYKWTNISPSGTSPSPRSGHSTVLRNATLWVFGGEGYAACTFDLTIPRNECLTYTPNNDLWAFDLASQSWSAITPAGTPPTPRKSQTAALNSVGEYLMIFGGLVYGNYNNDIAKYYFATNSWVLVPTSYPAADPRYDANVFPVTRSQNLSSDLFILMFGRGYMGNDLATFGVLYAGPLIEIEPPPVNIETQTDTVILSFDRKSPVQRLTPIDQCGDRVDSSAVTITFASLTEISPNRQNVQQVNFQKSAYELNATIAAMNPAFNFGLNSTAGLQLALDFQLFGVQTLINYAGESFLVDQSTNKWSFDISGWRFLDTANSLEIDVLLELAGGNRFSRYAITSVQGSRTKYTFFSPVIAFSVVISSAAELIEPDGLGGTTTSIISIDHTILFDPNTPEFQNPKVLFTFPYFGNGSILRYDPDFGVVVESDAQPDSSCGDFEGWKIAVIVVTTILPLTVSCLVVIIVALVIIIKRSRRPINEEEMVAFERNDSSATTEDNTPTNSSREDDSSAASTDSEEEV